MRYESFQQESVDKREEEEGAQRDEPPVEEHSRELYFHFRVLAQTRPSTPGNLKAGAATSLRITCEE